MNRVILTYDGTDAIIHGSKIDQNAFIKDGELREYVNAIPTFSFKVFPNNPGYSSIENMLSTLTVSNFNQTDTIFDGRVCSIANVMTKNGLIYKNVTCEGELAYLKDIIIESYSVNTGTLLSSALSELMNQYNSKAAADKQFNVSSDNTGVPAYYSVTYKTAFDIVKDLCDMCEFEYRVSKINGIRYLEASSQFGQRSNTDIALSVNLRSLQKENKVNDIVTRFYPLGINKENDTYFTIAPYAQGRTYLSDSNLYNKYGLIEASKVYDDITISSSSEMVAGARKLYARARKDYSQMVGLLTSFTLSALDLSLINGDYNDLKLYNTHRVVTKLQSIDEEVRITGRVLKLDDPQNPALTFGVKQATLTSMVARG